MKKIVALLICFTIVTSNLWSWGFIGHRNINKLAVFALPEQLFGFYKKYIDYIEIHSIDPDKRRYLLADEGCKHFLDCDHYEHNAPIDTIPHSWFAAKEKYSEDTLKLHGIVPWHIHLMLHQLTEAFKNKDLKRILKYSADIGHYIADAHVPLHCTGNYNGQKTGQEGIHGLWESRIPKLLLDSMNLLSGQCSYLEKPQEFIFDRINESFAAVDSVLYFEKIATQMVGEEKKYSSEFTGNTITKNYSPLFVNTYHGYLNNMVERRMRSAILSVACFWYTAWINAGQPNLNHLTGELDEDLELIELEKKENKKILGREEHGHE